MSTIFLQPTPLPTIRGWLTPQLQRQTGRYSPVSGWTFDQEFRGLDSNQMLWLAQEYAQAGCEYEITVQFGVATLRTIDNRGNITIDTWEIGVNPQKISSLYNPRNIANCSANDLLVLSRFFTKGDAKLEDSIADLKDDGIIATLPDVITDSPTARLYKRIINGQTDYEYNEYVLRHTTNASNRGYYNVGDQNVGCIYTQAQFYNEIRNSNYWIFPCPNEIIGALNVIFYNLPAPIPNYLNGALKGGSQRVTAANNRVNICTEYKLNQWSTDEYASI